MPFDLLVKLTIRRFPILWERPFPLGNAHARFGLTIIGWCHQGERNSPYRTTALKKDANGR